MARLLQLRPMALNKVLWPNDIFMAKQVEIINSVEDNDETYVTAGNQLGKDHIAGNLVLNMFLRAIKEGKSCRIVTTSATKDHLNVLWSQFASWIGRCAVPLLVDDGG